MSGFDWKKLQPGTLVRALREPRLGVGHYVDLRNDQFLFRFANGEERRIVNPAAHRYVRIFLPTGVHVQVERNGNRLSADIEQDPDGNVFDVLTYVVRLEDHYVRVRESNIFPDFRYGRDPLEQFRTVVWDPPSSFFARIGMRNLQARVYEESEGLPAFLGSRIRPYAHQLYAVRRILGERLPRFVLADEVGLGKTIEAGLVIQSLCLENSSLRVLIVAPGSMSRQWLTEMYLRFGGRVYRHVDAPRWESASEQERREMLQSQFCILSTTALRRSRTLRDAVQQCSWDVLVVDEAHKIDLHEPMYQALVSISRAAEAMLALSATPSSRQTQGLLALLSLAAPHVYGPQDQDRLEERILMQSDVWDRLGYLHNLLEAAQIENNMLEQEILSEVAAEWEELGLQADPNVKRRLDEMRAGSMEAAFQLVGYIQEFYRVDHRMIRTRRSTVVREEDRWPIRCLDVVGYIASQAERLFVRHIEQMFEWDLQEPLQRALRGVWYRFLATTPQECLQVLQSRHEALVQGLSEVVSDCFEALCMDPGPLEEPELLSSLLRSAPSFRLEKGWLHEAIELARAWLAAESDGCARFRTAASWIEDHFRQGFSNKVLVFSQSQDCVQRFAEYLEEHTSLCRPVVFYADLPEECSAQAALRFQRDEFSRILICDESGGEGRNFQVASAVMHLDQPWQVSRVEQRIGRLDRVGREPERDVLSVVLQGPSAIEQALIKIYDEVFEVYHQSIGGLEFELPRLQTQVIRASCEGPQELDDLRQRLASEVQDVREKLDEAFLTSLDTSRHLLDEAQGTEELLSEVDGLYREEDVQVLARWSKLLGIFLREEEEHLRVCWKAEELIRPLPGLLRGRQDAVRDEFRCTLRQSRALDNESLQLLGPGHRLFDTLFDDLEIAPEGRATVFFRDLGPERHDRCFIYVVMRCFVEHTFWEQHNVPSGLLNRLRRHLQPDIRKMLFSFTPGQLDSLTYLPGDSFNDQLQPSDRVVGVRVLFRRMELPFLQSVLCSAWERARDLWVNGERADFVREAIDNLRREFEVEMGYLQSVSQLVEVSSRETEEAEQELAWRRVILEGMACERVDLEALAVVIGKSR